MEKNILVIHQGALGDLVLALSAIGKIRQIKKPELLCREHWVPLIRHLNVCEKTFSVDRGQFAGLYTDPPPLMLKSFFAPYAHIIIFSTVALLIKNIRLLAGCPVYAIEPRPDTTHQIHVTDFLISKLKRIFCTAPIKASQKDSGASPPHHGRVKQVLIHPGSGSLRKNWPLKSFIAIYHWFKEKRVIPKWVVGPAENDLLEGLKKHHQINKEDILPNISLVDFVDRLNITDLFIGNDSGLSHLAAYVGTPVIAIFGPSDIIRWHPVGANVITVSTDIECDPCFETKTKNCDNTDCLTHILPEKVFKILESRCFI